MLELLERETVLIQSFFSSDVVRTSSLGCFSKFMVVDWDRTRKFVGVGLHEGVMGRSLVY